ncbi:MAG: hypothetical protein NC215_00265 [Ruminococcus sp.]|nr:hypothetical protein [Ruminococcus sp.]
MEESILATIKKLLGITEDYTYFDEDILVHINTVFMTLAQIGVGSSAPFSIDDDVPTWDNFFSTLPQEDSKNFSAIKTYIYMKVKLVFDPPTSSAVMEAMTRTVSELEWRLNHQAETSQSKEEES